GRGALACPLGEGGTVKVPTRAALRVEWSGPGQGTVQTEGRREPFWIARSSTSRGELWVRFRGRTHRVSPEDFGGTKLASGAREAEDPRAPMPGVVLRVAVADGDVVSKGGLLVAIEAMKIEHEVRAAAAGRVARVHVKPGMRVDAGALLVELLPVKAERRPGGRKDAP